MRAASVAIALAVGACAYRPGSFSSGLGTRFAGTPYALGCIDLAIAAGEDDRAHGPVVHYQFGNRCEHRVIADFASVRAVVVEPDGTRRPLVAFDPRREIRPRPLGARDLGDEQIEYTDPTGTSAPEWCVDIGGIDTSAPPHEQWVCVGGSR